MPLGRRRYAQRFLALWLLGIAAFAGEDARAELIHTTEYRTHAVRGTTPKAVWQYMNAYPIIDPDDGRAYANLTHEHDLSIKVANRNGACSVSALTFRWRFVLTLPKAVDQAGMDASTRSMWSAFVAGLKGHEEAHRAIFLRCGAKFVPAAARITQSGGCTGLERKVRQSIDRAYRACMVEQRAFEQRDRPRIHGLAFIKAAKNQ